VLPKKRPKYDRFNWRKKFDYWAIFWGMFIIGGSRAIVTLPVLVSRFLPGRFIPAALIAHGDEAMLAVIWIFIVHIFFNHFTPDYFPLNKSSSPASSADTSTRASIPWTTRGL